MALPGSRFRFALPALGVMTLLALGLASLPGLQDVRAEGDASATAPVPAAAPTAAEAAAPQPMASAEPGPVEPGAAPAAGGIDVAAALAERSKGNPAAPVTMIEYSSLTCPHCARFNREVLPALQGFVDAGTLRIVKRDYPLDQVALTAGAVARCLPERHYFRFIEALFASQKDWSRAPDPALAVFNMAKLLGMSEAQFEACVTNEQLLEGILQGVQEANQRYNVTGTPTLVFNETEILGGGGTIEDFTRVIQRLASAAPAPAPTAQ